MSIFRSKPIRSKELLDPVEDFLLLWQEPLLAGTWIYARNSPNWSNDQYVTFWGGDDQPVLRMTFSTFVQKFTLAPAQNTELSAKQRAVSPGVSAMPAHPNENTRSVHIQGHDFSSVLEHNRQ